MNLARANTLYRHPSSQQSLNLDKSPIPWNRRLDSFKTLQQNTSSLGPQEEEIEKIYGQIHYWVELLNEKFGASMKKKEENCMIAFKKVMLSVEKDLKDIRQQVDDSQKITRDTSEDDAFTNLQKQLAFFRDESISLSKKLKAAEDQIKELKKKNKELADDAQQDHQILLQSQRERKALKTLLLTAGTLKSASKQPEGSGPSSAFSSRQLSRHGNEWYESKLGSDANFESRRSSGLNLGSVAERKNKMSKTSRTSSSQSKSVESRYKKENLHLNSLKEQLEQTLMKKTGFLNSDKTNEIVQMVSGIVMKHIQAQEQQLNTLNSKIMKIKKFYQSILKNQVGAEIPSSLYELLSIFSDVFSSYRGREGLENIGRLTARASDNDSIGFYKTELPSYQYPAQSEGANRSSILESIKGINQKYGQLGIDDKAQMMQKMLNDPSVAMLLTNYVESYKMKTRGETSPGYKLISTRESGSHPQSPAGKKFLESEVEERHGQLNMYRDNYYFAKMNSQRMDEKPSSQDIRRSLSSLTLKRGSYEASNDRSLPIQSFREVESNKEYKGNSMEGRSSTFKDSHSFGHLECSDGMDVSFSTPVDVPRQRTVGDREIRMPAGEEKQVKDFRKKFLVKAGKALGS